MHEFFISVADMTCRHVARQISATVRDLEGVRTVRADVETHLVWVSGTVAPEDVVAALRAARHPALHERTGTCDSGP